METKLFLDSIEERPCSGKCLNQLPYVMHITVQLTLRLTVVSSLDVL